VKEKRVLGVRNNNNGGRKEEMSNPKLKCLTEMGRTELIKQPGG